MSSIGRNVLMREEPGETQARWGREGGQAARNPVHHLIWPPSADLTLIVSRNASNFRLLQNVRSKTAWLHPLSLTYGHLSFTETHFLSLSLFHCLSICLLFLSVCLSASLPVFLLVYLVVCLSVSVCLSVCMFLVSLRARSFLSHAKKNSKMIPDLITRASSAFTVHAYVKLFQIVML